MNLTIPNSKHTESHAFPGPAPAAVGDYDLYPPWASSGCPPHPVTGFDHSLAWPSSMTPPLSPEAYQGLQAADPFGPMTLPVDSGPLALAAFDSLPLMLSMPGSDALTAFPLGDDLQSQEQQQRIHVAAELKKVQTAFRGRAEQILNAPPAGPPACRHPHQPCGCFCCKLRALQVVANREVLQVIDRAAAERRASSSVFDPDSPWSSPGGESGGGAPPVADDDWVRPGTRPSTGWTSHNHNHHQQYTGSAGRHQQHQQQTRFPCTNPPVDTSMFETSSSPSRSDFKPEYPAAAAAASNVKTFHRCDLNGCDRSFATLRDLRRHQQSRKHGGPKRAQVFCCTIDGCSSYGHNFTREDNLKRHRRRKHSL